MFFRVVLFKRISKFFNVYIGMILSSLLFGVLHMELAIVGAVIFGFANCILYLKYRNILIPMTVHFLNNFLVSIPTFLSSDSGASSEAELLSQSDASAYLTLGAIVFIIGMILFIRFIVKNRKYIESDAFDNKTYNFNRLL
ncbi:MAG: CPBP family intramembrane glutamic endopeptidase [Clostridiales bacterium]|nr:CPBP family intramembrane glutamic endopeptidase [Clostridiales bacterium]